MLKQILGKLSEEGYLSRSALAKELKISESVLDDGLEQLLRMGYIVKEETGESCSVSCSACPLVKGCHKEIIKTYRISEKGQAII